jgi:hypothetical protein
MAHYIRLYIYIKFYIIIPVGASRTGQLSGDGKVLWRLSLHEPIIRNIL